MSTRDHGPNDSSTWPNKYASAQKTLREMGFSDEAITEALTKNGSLDAATAYLLGEDATRPHPEPAKLGENLM